MEETQREYMKIMSENALLMKALESMMHENNQLRERLNHDTQIQVGTQDEEQTKAKA